MAGLQTLRAGAGSLIIFNRASLTRWTVVAATVELAVTGLVLLARPQQFAWLLAAFSEAGEALGRLTTIALLVLTPATWPTPAATSDTAASVHAPLVYNLPTTIYFVYVGISGRS